MSTNSTNDKSCFWVLIFSASKKILLFVLLGISIISCKKYLDDKPIKTQLVPSTLSDLQALLDAYRQMNINYPALQEIFADNYYVTSAHWAVQSLDNRSNYIWNSSTYTSTYSNWFNAYNRVYIANFVLDQLPQIEEGSSSEYNNIKGQALFFRSYTFYGVAQLWCRPYSSSAATDLGIPLRLTAAVEERSVRSTVQQTYDRIVNDLKEAASLLPEISLAPSRPNKAAAYGALARTYLSMRDYINAGRYADSVLRRNSTLMDFNPPMNPNAPAPIVRFNPETIFYNILTPQTIINPTYAKIDSTLYQSYNINDLRKVIFFKNNGNGTFSFKGSYDGSSGPGFPFNGIATDEMYLIRAECNARLNNVITAMDDLNTLMIKRWKNTVPYPTITATDATDALNKILVERRKELIFRGLRWSDLRRLNLEGANITLTRIINGTTYTLTPNDLRWVLLIPIDVIELSGMPQNPR